MLRPLGETLVELVESVMPDAGVGLRVSSAYIDIPIAVRVTWGATGFEFLADIPDWRWETFFDPLRGRLKLSVGEGGPA